MNIFLVVAGIILIIVFILENKKFHNKIYFTSDVEGFEGLCYPVWLNTSEIDLRTQSCGVTGFFRLKDKKKSKEEFHGYIDGKFIHTTEGIR